MKTNCFLLLLLVSVMLGFCGCFWIESFKRGCYEQRTVYNGTSTYCCVEGDYYNEDFGVYSGPYGVEFNPWENSNDQTVVAYDDKSCHKLGYREHSGDFYYNKDGNDQPGKNSFWTGSGGGGNTPAFCADGYESPNVGPQVDGFCEMAFNAQCILGVPNTDERVTSPCNTWKDWQQMDPSIPNCKYCP